MRKVIASMSALALLISLCACTATQPEDQGAEVSQPPTWQEQYDLGVRYLSEGNYQEAILAFTAAIKIDPKRAPAYVGRGDAYVKSGETEENLTAAKADYEKGIELDETIVEAYLGLADIYIRQGEYEKALEVLNQGLETIGDDSRIVDCLEQTKKAYIANVVENGDNSAFYREEELMTPKDWRANGKPIYECEVADFQAEFPCEAESALFGTEEHWTYRPQRDDDHKQSNLAVEKREGGARDVLTVTLQLGSLQHRDEIFSYFFQPDLKGIYLEESFDEVLKKLGLTELGIQYCKTAEKPIGITVNRSFVIRVTSDGASAEPIVYFTAIENGMHSHISFRFHEGCLWCITGEFVNNWSTQVLF